MWRRVLYGAIFCACLAAARGIEDLHASDRAHVRERRANYRESVEQGERLETLARQAGQPNFAVPGDAAYSLPEGVFNNALKILHEPPLATRSVLLVPGTAYGGEETYNTTLAKAIREDPVLGSRAIVATLEIPGMSLNDIQLSGEYVAYGLRMLQQRTRQPATVVSWSQGSVNVQWAFKFYPSSLTFTHNFVALAPIFGGTVRASQACFIPRTCSTAILQQKPDSAFLTALAADCGGRLRSGRSSFVPTTIVASLDDGIVVPRNATQPSYALAVGAAPVSTIVAQQVCPPNLTLNHSEQLVNFLPVSIVLQAIMRGGVVAPNMLQLNRICGGRYTGLEKSSTGGFRALKVLAVIANGVFSEPKLRPFVC